MTVFHSFNLS